MTSSIGETGVQKVCEKGDHYVLLAKYLLETINQYTTILNNRFHNCYLFVIHNDINNV